MLRCVEERGTPDACSAEVDDFLACERAVFKAALHAEPPTEHAPEAPPQAPSPPPEVDAPDGIPARDPWTVDLIVDTVQRAAAKQGAACADLARTIAQRRTVERVAEFGGRMAADMGKTAEAARRVAGRLIAGSDDVDSGEGGGKDGADGDGG